MVNGPGDVYVEWKGRIERVVGRLFEGEEAVLHVMGWVGRPRPRGRFVDALTHAHVARLGCRCGSRSDRRRTHHNRGGP